MSARKQYTDEEIRKRRRESQVRWEKKNPDKIKAKEDRRNAKVKAERQARRAAMLADKEHRANFRVCILCNTEKPNVEFKRQGAGYTNKCLVCSPVITKKELNDKRKPRHTNGFATKRAPEPLKSIRELGSDVLSSKVGTQKKQAPLKDNKVGWTLILGDFYGGGMKVYHREGVLCFEKPDRTRRYGVMGDDSGGCWTKLEKAEKVRDKLWTSAS